MDTLKKLDELLSDRGMTLYTLAKACDINYTTLYSAVKRGSPLSVDTIERLCGGLGIQVYEFFMSTEDWKNIEEYALRRKKNAS